MKTVFVAPRATVDLLEGRCVHQAVQLGADPAGDWMVVAEIHDDELRAAVLAAAGTAALPHPHSGQAPAAEVADRLAPAAAPGGDAPAAPVEPVAPPATTRAAVEQVVARCGMPALLALLDH